MGEMASGTRTWPSVASLRPASGRRPELDGLRGIAVLLVVIGHMTYGVSPHEPKAFLPGFPGLFHGGGITGVQLFFVLSGYLITIILVAGISDRGARSFGNFYARRAARLLPALIMVCAVYAVFVAVAREGSEQALGFKSVLSALTYTSNLPLITSDYWLGHTWTLAVEEQFYLAWPVGLLIALRVGGTRAALAMALAIIAATVAVRHTPLMSPTTMPALRWDALLVGAVIALVPLKGSWMIGALGVAVLAYYSFFVSLAPDVYLVTAIAAAAVIVSARDHQWLANPVLQFFGLISYGLYLWHVLVMRFGWPGPVSLLVSVVVATASYLFVELRFLRWHASRREEARLAEPAPTGAGRSVAASAER